MISPYSFHPDTTACFTGHRFIPEQDCQLLRLRLQSALLQAYGQGYRVFLCGGARGFDTIAELEVIRFRTGHPDVRLVIVVPCAVQADRWPDKDRILYRKILEQADERIVLSDHYYNGCMQVRNRFMVDASSLCLCYMLRFEGGTWSTVRYALRCGIHLRNLAIPDSVMMREKSWNSISISPSVSGNAHIVHLYPFPRQTWKRKPVSKRLSMKRR